MWKGEDRPLRGRAAMVARSGSADTFSSSQLQEADEKSRLGSIVMEVTWSFLSCMPSVDSRAEPNRVTLILVAYLWRMLQQGGDVGTIKAGLQLKRHQSAAALQAGLQR
jgi:hypothetical protein